MTAYGERLWQPDSARIARAALTRFQRDYGERRGATFADYDALQRDTVAQPGEFWAALAAFAGVRWRQAPRANYIAPPAGRMLGARWFDGGTLSFTENLLAKVRDDAPDVIIAHAEGAARRQLGGAALKRDVARCAAALAKAGIGSGDVVAGVLANVPEAIVAMLATAALGAIWTSCSPDFGAPAVVDRFGQTRPRVLFATAAYVYGGKRHNAAAVVADAVGKLAAVGAAPTRVIVIDHLGDSPGTDAAWTVPVMAWGSFLEDAPATGTSFAALPFDHPLYILYSSGTTGAPKCITHGAGGTLLQHLKEHLLHSDVGPGDRMLYYTTLGWMMWNWMVSALAAGAGLVLYEGSPAAPDTGVLWRIARDDRVTHLGVSPKLLAATAQAGTVPRDIIAGAALRCLMSTGSPLLPEQFAWVYRDVGADLHLASISGGTDIVSCFMLGVPTLPVHAGEIQRPGLGMAVEAWDDDGKPVRGDKGELVCVAPFPSMPVKFWNDPDGAKYHKAYFEHYGTPAKPAAREVWRHGDFIAFDKDSGGIVVYGRSDATLNPGGVRIGTAELYRQVETVGEVQDSVAIAREEGGDVAIVLYVKLRPGVALDEALTARIKGAIRAGLSPRHVPREVRAVQDIPYTRSGKKVELAVADAVHGRPVKNMAALANPECMAEFVALSRS